MLLGVMEDTVSFSRLPFKRLFRFSLGTLLFASLCVCGYLSGYHNGYRSGVRQQFRDTISVVTYDVEFVHTDDPSTAGMKRTTDELMELFRTCYPDRWGGPFVQTGMEASPDFMKIEVTNYGYVHEDIESVLGELREQRR